VQRGIQALQDDRAQLKSSIGALASRVQHLEGALQASSKQVVALQQLIIGMAGKGVLPNAAAAAASNAMPPPGDPAHAVSQALMQQLPGDALDMPVMQVAAALQMISQNAAAQAAGAAVQQALPVSAPASDAAPPPPEGSAAQSQPQPAGNTAATPMSAPPTMPGVSVPNAEQGAARSGQLDQLGPIAQLQHTSTVDRLNNVSSMPQVQDALGARQLVCI
jgi:hypothetical protein